MGGVAKEGRTGLDCYYLKIYRGPFYLIKLTPKTSAFYAFPINLDENGDGVLLSINHWELNASYS